MTTLKMTKREAEFWMQVLLVCLQNPTKRNAYDRADTAVEELRKRLP